MPPQPARRPAAALLLALLVLPPCPAAADQGFLRLFSPAEQLGGELTLDDLGAPMLPPLALAEQARVRASRDPFAALPEHWRAPWRRIKATTPGVQWRPARRVVASWPGLSAASMVPLLQHSDGSVDVFLDGPGTPALAEALKALLDRLGLPPAGSVQPLLLELQPRPWVSSLQ